MVVQCKDFKKIKIAESHTETPGSDQTATAYTQHDHVVYNTILCTEARLRLILHTDLSFIIFMTAGYSWLTLPSEMVERGAGAGCAYTGQRDEHTCNREE